ncbi:uncharacterized protein N7443_009240 [Penicillium atrosanguineum]|nr:uncharacterized protein N7443_009240 [Penicillium atrosanguineum]KAJ5293287.1 hypothetical protein N7443_009240 [Penicillium atrosanguineum]
MTPEGAMANLKAAMSVCVVAPTPYPGVRNILRKKISKPVLAICRCPCRISMSIQAVDGNNAVSQAISISVTS